jgi:ABC-2 type transport system ATP-binding protein
MEIMVDSPPGTAPSPDDTMIVVEGLCKSFPVGYGFAAWVTHRGRPPRKPVLHGIDLKVRRGELLGLLGPNGAGKTTLLKSLATLAIPDAGRVVIDGVDVARRPLEAKRKIGLCISEERSFYYRLTARANLEFFGSLVGLRGAALTRRVEEVIEQVDLGFAIDRRFSGFSSGMRQRLTVARALLGDPPVVLLDEPTRAVDPVHAEELRHFIRHDLVSVLGKTVILATNLLEEAWRICDRVAVVSGGRIVALGPPNSLDAELHRVSRYEVTVDRADETLLARIHAVGGLTLTQTVPDAGGITLHLELNEAGQSLTDLFRAVSCDGVRLCAFKSVEPSPVDIFQKVTTTEHAG